MVSKKSVEKQLKGLGFNMHGWGKGEIQELSNIILPKEEIYEVVNGIYEGGFALLLASDVRVLLVDKKPLNYLTVEDIRFDQINEIDYSHRLFGANINIATGPKNLRFRSYNQHRLRKLINHVQHCMAETKKKETAHAEGQHDNLEQLNQQLRSYLLAQHEQQQKLQEQLMQVQAGKASPDSLPPPPPPVEPSAELADYLFAQGLLTEQGPQTDDTPTPPVSVSAETGTQEKPQPAAVNQMADLYNDGMKEVFGAKAGAVQSFDDKTTNSDDSMDPMQIAFSKLPMALRNRKFKRPFQSSSPEAKPGTEPAA